MFAAFAASMACLKECTRDENAKYGNVQLFACRLVACPVSHFALQINVQPAYMMPGVFWFLWVFCIQLLCFADQSAASLHNARSTPVRMGHLHQLLCTCSQASIGTHPAARKHPLGHIQPTSVTQATLCIPYGSKECQCQHLASVNSLSGNVHCQTPIFEVPKMPCIQRELAQQQTSIGKSHSGKPRFHRATAEHPRLAAAESAVT